MFTSCTLLILSAGIISSFGHPIDPKVVLPVADGFGILVIGTCFLIISVVALIACSCCKLRRDGFKEFRNAPTVVSCGDVGFTNALASSELSIFPPPGNGGNGGPRPLSSPLNASPTFGNNPPSRPAAFTAVIPSVSDWFIDKNANFPRQQLFYQKEIGKGWFGKVVKGEARGAKVVVRILREDATPEEKAYFLHEAKPFRDLRHKNVTRLFARCLENDPYLLLFEFSTNGDLKSFLVTNSSSRNAITEQKISLKMMLDVTEGLKFMNENKFIHTDIAARNCLVGSDLTVKIGDYGTSIDKYKNEYYIVGDMAVPIRWCAPETLNITTTTIETKQVTEAGNVWSLAVLLWEIAEFGKMPYAELSDEEVIYQVLSTDGKTRLPQPNCPFGQYMHHIMGTCWKTEEGRATIEQVLSMLVYLKSNPFQDSDFETRWKTLKPNTVPVVDNHTPIHSPRHTFLAQRPKLPAKLEFDSGVDLEIKPTDENPDSCRTSTPNTISPQLSVTSEEIFQPVQHKSPSLTNLKGSLENVGQFDSWLMGVEQKTEEDRTFVKNISEAIKNLDETLALEKTSSSSADSSMDGTKKPLLDFKLGPLERERKGDSSSSDTEEETWRNRIERGEFTEKVKEKSKSVTDLMVLTHIDSEGSESDSLPSLTRQYSLKKNVLKGVSFTGVGFGSEGNIRNAVLSEELQEKLKQLTLWKTDTDQSFLVKGASETIFSISVPASSCKKSDIKLVKSSNLYRDNQEKIIIPNVSSCNESINNMSSVMKEDIVRNVNTLCNGTNSENECSMEKQSEKVKSSESTDRKSSQIAGHISSEVQSDSSHPIDSTVPKIVITESELPEDFNEPESHVNTQFIVDIKPRKFVFVCRDLDDSEFEESSSKTDLTQPDTVLNSPEELTINPSCSTSVSNTEQSDSTVILGPSDEHTLDFFKGLKTTFMPADELYSASFADVNDIDVVVDVESEVSDNEILKKNHCDNVSDKDNVNFVNNRVKDYPLPDVVPELFNINLKSFVISNNYENHHINGLINDSVEHSNEVKYLFEKSNDIAGGGSTTSNSAKDISEEDDEIPLIINDKLCFQKYNFHSDRTLNSNDSLRIDSPVVSANVLNSRNSSTSDTESCSSSVNSSEEQLVEAPYPFNQPLSSEHQVKSKSLDSFLISQNNLDRSSSLNSGVLFENIVNGGKQYVPVFNMTESVSDNAFMNDNVCYDPYYSLDSGHSSDRCVEQDKQMNDLKSRLEDVVRAGSEFQLKNSEEEYGVKLLTPDDERSSDSGFRDKGSLSESVEDTCDEKYNLEDIDAELEDFTMKSLNKDEYRYYEQLTNEPDKDNSPWFVPIQPEAATPPKENGWLSQSTENEEAYSLSIDADFAAAIRNELNDKLPGAQQSEKSDEDNSPDTEEQEVNTESTTQFVFPTQLSPILEEQESNHSSLQLNDSSPIFVLPPPDSKIDSYQEDIVNAFEHQDSSSNNCAIIVEDLDGDDDVVEFDDDKIVLDDDVLVIDTETNEATIIESPKPHSHLAFILPAKDDQTVVSDYSPDNNSDHFILSPDNGPLTPNSVETDSHSSPENGNMSGFFLSPCSIRSDLFDSGPPSLPFDLGQSLDEVEDLPLFKVPSSENLTDKNDMFGKLSGSISSETVCEEPTTSNQAEETINELDACKGNGLKYNDIHIKDKDLLISDISLEEPKQSGSILSEIIYPETNLQRELAANELLKPHADVCTKAESHLVDTPLNHDYSFTRSHNDEKPLDLDKTSPKKNTFAEDKWLTDLLIPKSSDDVKENAKNNNISNCLNNKDWPALDELIGPDHHDKSEKTVNLRPNINSTLALLSPDLSSNDSKSLSVLSSFSSTPTSEESRTVYDILEEELKGNERLVKPKSLSLKGDVSGIKGNVIGALGVPMPSPEDAEKGWRPTICQLMELTDQAAADGEEMTTSFIEPDENGIYTPDWESDMSEEHSSSSSGEFVWKEGDKEDLIKCVSSDTNSLLDEMGPVMERIDEEDEDRASTSSSSDSDTSSTDSGRIDFVPFTWNSLAVPAKSVLKPTPCQKTEHCGKKKRVVFKKEKYQCVYEYPREDSDSDDDDSIPAIWQTPPQPQFDYSVFADWDFADAEMPTPVDTVNSDSEDVKKPPKEEEIDFYRLDYNLAPQGGERWSETLPEDDTDFNPLASDLTPVRLGDLKHTKATLRLELPVLRPDQGEASLLDSGIDTASVPE